MSLYERVRAFFAPKDQLPAEPANGRSPDGEAEGAHEGEGERLDHGVRVSSPEHPRSPPNATGIPSELRVLQTLAAQSLGSGEALASFRALRGTIHERAALRAVHAAHEARRADEALRTDAAALLVARGEPGPALTLLADLSSLAAWSVRAEAEERSGDHAAARRSLERVLALDIDAVGVRGRLERLRERGGVPTAVPLSALPTMATGEETRASYRIVSELGRGGASAVFRATDILLGRSVALKVFHRPRENRAQLQREAELAVRARGPHVVRVFDADLDQGFLAMELAEGGALRRLLRGGQEAQVLHPFLDTWLSPLVEAVGRVHALGLVHGDIKAGNVLFRRDGTPLLADFGLSRPPGEPYEGGTPGTLSPERMRDGIAHQDDDVYALGVLLAEALDRGLPSQRPTEELRALSRRWMSPRGERPNTMIDRPA